MKKIFLFVFLQIAMSSLFAQTNVPEYPPTETQVINGFTVALRSGNENTYFFDIFKKGETQPIIPNYPLSTTVIGYSSKKEAFKAAKSLIDEFKRTGHFPPINAPHPNGN